MNGKLSLIVLLCAALSLSLALDAVSATTFDSPVFDSPLDEGDPLMRALEAAPVRKGGEAKSHQEIEVTPAPPLTLPVTGSVRPSGGVARRR